MRILKKIIYGAVLPSVAVMIFLFFFRNEATDVYYDDEVQLYNIKKTDLDESLYLSAYVTSDNIEIVYSNVDAPIADVKVRVGDTVKPGDVICVFDCSEIQKEYDNYLTLLEQATTIDTIYASNFYSNSEFEKLILENQIEQEKKQIEINQNKYNEILAIEAEYRSMYESAVAEVNRLASILEADKNRGSETAINENSGIIDDVCSKDTSTEDSSTGETNSNIKDVTYDTTSDYYEFAVKKRDFSYEKQTESKKNAEEIKEVINNSQMNLDSLIVEYDSIMNSDENYFSDSKRNEMIRFYTEKVNEYKEKINCSIVTANSAGIITDLYVTTDDFVKENRICCIQDPDNIHFSGFITPENVLNISDDNPVLVCLPANDYNEVEGKITFISEKYNTQKKGYEISFSIDNISEYDLYPGLDVSARIILECQKDTLIVPYDAIFERKGETFVRRYDNSGNYKDIPVKKGLSTGYYVSVEAPELSENDLVATNMLD